MKQINKVMRNYVSGCGMTVEEIDKKFRFEIGLTNRIISGRENPTLEEIAKISICLNLDLNRILAGKIKLARATLSWETIKLLAVSKMVRDSSFKEVAKRFGVDYRTVSAWLKFKTELPLSVDLTESEEYIVILPRKWWW